MWVSAVLKLLTAGLEAWAVWQQYRLRDYLNKQYRNIQNDIDELDEQIIDLRRAGRDSDADRLLFNKEYLSSLRASTARGVSVFAARPVVHLGSSGKVGDSGPSGTEGSGDYGPH